MLKETRKSIVNPRSLMLLGVLLSLCMGSSAFAVKKKKVCANTRLEYGWVIVSHLDYGSIGAEGLELGEECTTIYNWIIADMTTARHNERLLVCGIWNSVAVDGWKIIGEENSSDCLWGDKGNDNATILQYYAPNSNDDDDDDDGDSCKKKWYHDKDGDGLGDPNDWEYSCIAPHVDYTTRGTDCNDKDPNAWRIAKWCRDADGDEAGDPETAVVRCGPGGDNWDDYTEWCNDKCDNDPTTRDYYRFYRDKDDDGFGDYWNSVVACVAPEGYVDNSDDDCDDDPNRTKYVTAFRDVDGDGYGSRGYNSEGDHYCYVRDGFVTNGDDLNDRDNLIHSKKAVDLFAYRSSGAAFGYHLGESGEISISERIFADFTYGGGIFHTPSGPFVVNSKPLQWEEDVDKIISYQQDSRSFLLFYKNNGQASIVEMNQDGTKKSEVYFSESWTEHWSVIEPFSMHRQTYILFYKPGLTRIYKMKSDGGLGARVFTADDWYGADDIKHYVSEDGTPYLLLYNRRDGALALHTISEHANKFELQKYMFSWTKGYTSIVSIKDPSGSYLLFYRESDGAAKVYDVQKGHSLELVTETNLGKDWDTVRTYASANGGRYVVLGNVEGDVEINEVDIESSGVDFIETYYNDEGNFNNLVIY